MSKIIESHQHPTLPDWTVEHIEPETAEHLGWTLLHGRREDQPSEEPLIVCLSPSAISAFQQFSNQAREWDKHAMLPHRRVLPVKARRDA